MGMDASSFHAGLAKAQVGAQKFAGTLSSITGPLSKITNLFGVGLSAGAAAAGIRSLSNYADNLDRVSESSGVGIEKLQGFRHLVDQNGGSADEASASLDKFNRRLGSSAEAADQSRSLFGKWGLSVKDANGAIRRTEELLGEALDLIKATPHAATRSAIAFDLFGDSGFRMVKALSLGSDALDEVTDKLVAQSRIIRTENVAALVELKSATDAAFDSLRAGAGNKVGFFARLGLGFSALVDSIRSDSSAIGEIFKSIEHVEDFAARTVGVIQGLHVSEIDTSGALERLNGGRGRQTVEDHRKALGELKNAQLNYFKQVADSETKLRILKQEQAEAQSRLMRSQIGSTEALRAEADLYRVTLDLSKQRAAVEEERASATERRRDAEAAIAGQFISDSNSILDRGRLSKDELRNFDLGQVSDPAVRRKIAAQQANLLSADRYRAAADQLRMHGQFDRASGLNIQADRRESRLTLLRSSDQEGAQMMQVFNSMVEGQKELIRMAREEGYVLRKVTIQ